MKKAFAVFKRDLRRIVRNPVALLVVIGICVVPCLYAWINVLANWDPYENTSDIPVAVVNQDETVNLDEVGEICVGDLMVDALKENDKIGWRFMDEDEALENVRAGTCYAAIIIPSDFTKSLTGILDGKVEKAHLKYYVNEKVNPIAPKVTDTGATTVSQQIDSKFIAKVGEVVAEKLGDASDKIFEKSGAFLGNELSVLDEVHVTLLDVSDQVGKIADKIHGAQDALNEAVDKFTPLQGVGSRVADKLDGALGQLATTRSNANKLISDINAALDSGASQVSSIHSSANADIATIASDIALAQSQINAAIRALENDLTDNQALTSGITNAHNLVVEINPKDANVETLRLDIERELSTDLGVTVQLSEAQQAKIEELRAIASRLEDAAEQVKAATQTINGQVQATKEALQNVQSGVVSDTLTQVSSALDNFASVGNQLEAAAKTVDPIIDQTISLARQFSEALSGADKALGGTRTTVDDLASSVESLNSELAAIRASDMWSYLQSLVATNPEGVSDFLSAPVTINEIDLFPVENYGSGVAPFFSSLALWVGGIALVAIFKLEVDEEEVGKLRPWQAYFGRWMTFVLLGTFQAIACCTGDLIIGIQCAYPWMFYLSAIVASFAFVNIIYGLSVAFKHLGKALAFTLVILQVPGSAGMYPIEMMPPFFQAINPWLPFTYSINAMREAIAGLYGNNFIYNLGMLLAFVIPSILLGVTARARLVNVNALFDRRLRETDHLMVSEPLAIEGNHYRMATVVKALLSPQEYREELDERSAAFEKAYPKLVSRGILLLVALPLALFALMLSVDAKLPTIAAFVISIIVIYIALILIEFFHDRIRYKRALTELSEEELIEVMHDTMRNEFMPLAPVDAILERRRKREEARQGRPLQRIRNSELANTIRQGVHEGLGFANAPESESSPAEETPATEEQNDSQASTSEGGDAR
ncbi:MAG: YhgE/Pip domain-containing protein [Coriobacteriales bacterium]|nr:YhgE/Pip domain-containing protein [Coriobacteriales bacterium]